MMCRREFYFLLSFLLFFIFLNWPSKVSVKLNEFYWITSGKLIFKTNHVLLECCVDSTGFMRLVWVETDVCCDPNKYKIRVNLLLRQVLSKSSFHIWPANSCCKFESACPYAISVLSIFCFLTRKFDQQIWVANLILFLIN